MEIGMVLIQCCDCGVPFAISQDMQARLLKCRNTFYCPNGHGQHFTGDTEEHKLRRELSATKFELDSARRKIADLQKKPKARKKSAKK